jgi:NADH-quinone oxidoreductase subunit N
VVAAINTVVSIFYYARVLAPVYFTASAGRVATLGRLVIPVAAASAGILVVTGIVAQPLVATLAAAVPVP